MMIMKLDDAEVLLILDSVNADIFVLCNRFCDTKISNIDVLVFQYGLYFVVLWRIILGLEI